MRVVIQRSGKATCVVNNEVTGSIEKGLVVLVGFTHEDLEDDLNYVVNKIVNLRIFPDEAGVMNKSLLDFGGDILSISQFTLYGNTKKGNRPSYLDSLGGEAAIKLYELFNDKLRAFVKVETGIFGADMDISLTNIGPTTIIIDSKNK